MGPEKEESSIPAEDIRILENLLQNERPKDKVREKESNSSQYHWSEGHS